VLKVLLNSSQSIMHVLKQFLIIYYSLRGWDVFFEDTAVF